MRRIVITSIVVISLGLIIYSCDDDSSISGTGSDSTVVLLSSGFNQSVSPSQWEVLVTRFGSYWITEEGLLLLRAGSAPGGLGDIARIESKDSWNVEEGDVYLLTMWVDLCSCSVNGEQALGFVCNSSTSEFLGMIIRGYDYGQAFFLYDGITDCSVQFPDNEPSAPCEGIHKYSFKLNSSSIKYYIDDQFFGELSASPECDLYVVSFYITCSISGFYNPNRIALDRVILEKYKYIPGSGG